MVRELINGEPGSAQAIIQRVCAEVSARASAAAATAAAAAHAPRCAVWLRQGGGGRE